MKTLKAFLFAALLTPSAFAGESVTFSYAPIEGKQTVTYSESQSMRLDMEISADGNVIGVMKMSRSETEDVRAVLGTWTEKKRSASISYGENKAVETETDPTGKARTNEKKSPVAGKSYAIDWKAKEDQIQITTEGGEVSDAEKKVILKDWGKLSATEPDDFPATIAGKTLEEGQEVISDATAMRNLMGIDDDKSDVKEAKMVFKELREQNGAKLGVFVISLTMGAPDNGQGMNMTMNINGEVLVSVEGLALHSAKLTGPIKMNATQQQGEQLMLMNGTGLMELSSTITYEK